MADGGGEHGIPQPMYMDAEDGRFWEHTDRLVASSKVVIDRPRGTAHPRYPDAIYPLDYGYLEDTRASDGGGVDVWRGSLLTARVTGAIVTVDLLKRDCEIKLLLGCTVQEAEFALSIHRTASQAGLLLIRPRGNREALPDDP